MPIELTVLLAICTFLLGILTFSRNRDKDVKSEASRNAVIETKLDNISQGVDSIRRDIGSVEQRVRDLSDRVVRVEESTKQAHKRIDTMEIKGEI